VSSIPELQAKIKIARSRFQARPDSRVFAPLADLLREAGQYREALLLLDKGLSRYPKYVTGYVIKGRAMIEAGYADLGRDALHKALDFDPHNILALDLLIGEATERKAWRDVVGPLEKLVSLEPEDEKLVIFLNKVRQKILNVKSAPVVHEDYRSVEAEPVPNVELGDSRGTPEEPEIEPVAFVEPESESEPEPKSQPVPDPIDKVEADSESPDDSLDTPLPGASHVTMTMVDIYLAQGYREMAITALEEILEANPGRKDIQVKLSGLLDDPNCGVPESRKEKPASDTPALGKTTISEQRRKDKDQFKSWIDRVNDPGNGNDKGAEDGGNS